MTREAEPVKARGGKRAGAGRPPANTKQVTLRLSPETIRALRELADYLGLSMSEVAEKTLSRRLKGKK